MILYLSGRCTTWDLPVTDTLAASYLSQSAAEAASSRKVAKYVSNWLMPLEDIACHVKLTTGRMSRHDNLNDVKAQAFIRANIPAAKEPSGISRTDNKRPAGVTLIPWQSGRHLHRTLL